MSLVNSGRRLFSIQADHLISRLYVLQVFPPGDYPLYFLNIIELL